MYSPLDAVTLAQQNPDREVVFFAVGFETTAPANAMAVRHAHALGLRNFSVLVSHVLVPPAMEAILASPHNRVQGFLAAGHVCAVMGYEDYPPIAARYGVPIVVTGFEPVDILHGILMVVEQLEQGTAEVQNQYARSVSRVGNTRCCTEIPAGHSSGRNAIGMYQRSGLAGIQNAQRMPGLRNALHPGVAFGRPHGFKRRCLRGLLPLSRGKQWTLTALRSLPGILAS